MLRYDVTTLEGRQALIKHCNSDAIRKMKNDSIKEFEIYNNILEKHVRAKLGEFRSPESIAKMMVIDDIGVGKRIINQEASIYKKAPRREFSGLQDKQREALELVYQDMKYNVKSKHTNRYFKLQKQALTQIVPRGGKLIKKVLKKHQYTVVPRLDEPEEMGIVVIHDFNQPGEKDLQRYVVWTEEDNFTMNGNGLVLSEDPSNPIAPMLPFTDYSAEKDGDFYVDERETSTSFTIKLNAALTEIFHVMRMQGFGQPVMIGTKKGLPTAEEVAVGVNNVLMLITEEGQSADFKFVSANPDLQGSISVLSTLLSSFLSSKGIDPKTINFDGESSTFTSGFERLLSLIEKFEASEDDIEVFRDGEQNEFEIIKRYVSVLSGDFEQLDPKYAAANLPEDASISVEFERPEMIQTKPEKIGMLKESEEAGYTSRVKAIRDLYDFKSDDEAIEFIEKMEEHRKKLEQIMGPARPGPEQQPEA